MSKHVYVACARTKYPSRHLAVVASATEKGVTSWARGALLTLSLLHKTEPAYYDVEGFVLSATVASSAVWVKKVEFISPEWPDEEETTDGEQGAHESVHDGTDSVPGGGVPATGSATDNKIRV